MRSNCIVFALALAYRRWRRRARHKTGSESYLILRASRVPWGLFHVLYGKRDPSTDQIKVVSYKPKQAEKRAIELVFEGQVERGDAPPNVKSN